jgi:hypothetical protein
LRFAGSRVKNVQMISPSLRIFSRNEACEANSIVSLGAGVAVADSL